MADLSLDSLLASLQSAQEVKSTVRLSDRNIVELVQKLKTLGYFGDELLYTINGKEYITVDRLKAEIKTSLAQAGGRLALVELPTLVGVDLVHCERQAVVVVAESGGLIVEAQGELMSVQYFDAMAREVSDLLAESGCLSAGDLAVQYSMNTELLLSVVSARVGTIIQGRLEGTLLYTPAYLRNVKARLRGLLRGATVPVAMADVVRELGLEALGGGGVAATVAGLVEELVVAGAVRGSLKGGSGTWNPAIYSEAQARAVQSFYEQNGWVDYDALRKVGIPGDPKAYLRAAFADGIAAESAFISPSLLGQVEVVVEECVASSSWSDLTTMLPSALTPDDISVLLSKCEPLREAGKGRPDLRKAEVMASTCVVSTAFIQALQEQVENEARAAASEAVSRRKEQRSAGASASATAAPSPSGAKGAKAAAADEDDGDDDWGAGGKKGKKKAGGGKGKAAAAKGKGGAKGHDAPGDAGPAHPTLSLEKLSARLAELHPDFADAGASGELPAALAERLQPAAVAAYEATLASALTAGADARRRGKEAAAKAAEDAMQRLLLYGGGLAELAADEATHSAVQRHTVRTVGGEVQDCLLTWARLEFMEQEASEQPEAGPLTPSERSQLLKAAPPDVREALSAMLDQLPNSSVEEATGLLERAAGACGLRLRRPDKKGEKALLGTLKGRLQEALQVESSPAAALALAVPLLFLTATGRAVSLPGKAIGGVLQRLKGQLPESTTDLVARFHTGVVELLKAQSGLALAEGAEDPAVQLEELLPALKLAAGLEIS